MVRVSSEFEQRSFQHVGMGMMQLSLGTSSQCRCGSWPAGLFRTQLENALLSALNLVLILSWAGGLTRSPVAPSKL